jgi:Ring finger domain
LTEYKRLVHLANMSDKECSICLDQLNEAGATLRCGHSYHAACLNQWLVSKASCPECRAQVNDLPTVVLLARCRDPALFGTHARFDKAALVKLFPETQGSMYRFAVVCAHQCLDTRCPLQQAQLLAQMLVYLHICGDVRAGAAAASPLTESAHAIAKGLVRWDVTSLSPAPWNERPRPHLSTGGAEEASESRSPSSRPGSTALCECRATRWWRKSRWTQPGRLVAR